MRPDKGTERLLREIRLSTTAEEDERILADALAAMDQSVADRESPPARSVALVGKACRNRWAPCVAAAAAVLLLAIVGFSLWSGGGSGEDTGGAPWAVERDQAEQPAVAIRPAGGRGSSAAGPEWVTARKGEAQIELDPPRFGEVRLETNLAGERLNQRVLPGGWVDIGRGLLWNCSHLLGSSERSDWHPVGRNYLEVIQNDVRVYAIVDGGPRQLAGIRFGGAGDMRSMAAAMKELSVPTILWCEAPLPKEFSSLPNLVWILDLQRVPTKALPPQDSDKSTALSQAQGVKLVDLSPLEGLTGLTSLDLAGCDQVSNLSPLAGLTYLKVLNLAGCDQIVDLSPLAKLVNLESLDLAAWEINSQLSDLTALARLTKLRSLNLRLRMNVHDLSPLAALKDLESLNLDGCRIEDLAPLGQLTRLKSLSLRSSLTNVPDWSHLAKLANLESLAIDGLRRDVTDISPLTQFRKLEDLELSQLFGVSDLTPVGKLSTLTRLRIVALPKVSDISPLAKLANLESLALDNCDRVSDISPLAKLPKLNSLRLTGCEGVTDVSALRDLVSKGADVHVDQHLRGQLNAPAQPGPAAADDTPIGSR